MKESTKKKLDSIDKSKIKVQESKDLLAKIEKALNNDKNEENQAKAEKLLDVFIAKAKAKNADIFKTEEPAKAKTPAQKKQVAQATKSKLDALMDTIANDPLFKDFNSPRRVKGGGRSDALIDSERKARESGRRVSQKGWKNQYGKSKGGRRYYEYRENRIDRKAPNYGSKPWLEDGGLIHPSDKFQEKYSVIEIKGDGSRKVHNTFPDFETAMVFASLKRNVMPSNTRIVVEDDKGTTMYRSFKSGGQIDESTAMVLSQNKAIAHHTEELKNALSKNTKVEPWVVGKIERASTDISDVTHYLDGRNEYAQGGYMAKGGITKDSIKRTLTSDTSQYFLEKDGDGYILTITPRGAMNSNFWHKFNVKELPNDNTRLKYRLSPLGYAQGGYMADGGEVIIEENMKFSNDGGYKGRIKNWQNNVPKNYEKFKKDYFGNQESNENISVRIFYPQDANLNHIEVEKSKILELVNDYFNLNSPRVGESYEFDNHVHIIKQPKARVSIFLDELIKSGVRPTRIDIMDWSRGYESYPKAFLRKDGKNYIWDYELAKMGLKDVYEMFAKGGYMANDDYEKGFESEKTYLDEGDLAKIDARVEKEYLEKDRKSGVHDKFTKYWYNGGREKAIAKYGEDESKAWEEAYEDFKDDFYKMSQGGYMAHSGLVEEIKMFDKYNYPSQKTKGDKVRAIFEHFKKKGYSTEEINTALGKMNYAKGGEIAHKIKRGDIKVGDKIYNAWFRDESIDGFSKVFIKADSKEEATRKAKVLDEKHFVKISEGVKNVWGKYVIDELKNDGTKIYAKGGYMADGGKIKWQDVYVGDNALVIAENKMGMVVKTYGRRFHLKFPDGSEKTYSAEELEFFKDEEYAKGGKTPTGDYTNRRNLHLIVIKNPNKSGSKDYLTIDKKDFLDGLHKFEDGGSLSKNYTYIKRADVNQVAYYDKNGKLQVEFKPKNGFWVNKKALVDAGMNETKSEPKKLDFGTTSMRKTSSGWIAKNKVSNYMGYDWEITTMKSMRGDLVSTAVGGKNEKSSSGYTMFTYVMYQDPNVRLITSKPSRITEKVTLEQQEKALKEFETKVTDKWYAKGGKIGFEGLSNKVAKNYEGKKVAPKYRKEYGETYDKEEAKEVGDKVASKVYRQQLAKMEKGGKLPEDLGKYFIKTRKTKMVKMSDLKPLRARPTGIENAEKYMRMAYEGKMEKRKPITIYKSQGKYRVYDGNSTYAVAKANGWENIWAEVVKNPNMNTYGKRSKDIFTIAKEIRKEGEAWKDALQRAKAMK